jgi:hypothetical protein
MEKPDPGLGYFKVEKTQGPERVVWHCFRGPKGVVTFTVFDLVDDEERERLNKELRIVHFPMGGGFSYHSPTPQYEGQEPYIEECDFLGGMCYCDFGSCMEGTSVMKLVAESGDGIWPTILESYYKSYFEHTEE